MFPKIKENTSTAAGRKLLIISGSHGQESFLIFQCHYISAFVIHQIFSLARDWSKRVTWANIRGDYLFLVAHTFPRATLSENCSLLGTDNVRGQLNILAYFRAKWRLLFINNDARLILRRKLQAAFSFAVLCIIIYCLYIVTQTSLREVTNSSPAIVEANQDRGKIFYQSITRL